MTTVISPRTPIVLHYVSALRWFDPFSPISLIIGQRFGIPYYEMFLLQAVCSMTILLSELPAGILADRFGCRYVMILSAFFLSVAYILFMLFPSFLTWVIAELFAGLGIAFYSGADTALLYASCHGASKRAHYQKQEGLMQSLARWSEGMSSGLGFVAVLNARLPIILALIAKLTMLFLCATALPRQSGRPVKSVGTVLENKQVGPLEIFRLMRLDKQQRPIQHKILVSLFFYAALQSIVLINIFWMIQLTGDTLSLSLSLMSILWVLYFGLCAIVSYFLANRLLQYRHSQIILLPLISCLLLLLSAFMPIDLRMIPLVLFSVVYGLLMPLINSLINDYATKERRVMMHSCCATLTRLLFVLVAPITGYLAQYVSSEAAFLFLFVPSVLGSLLSFRVFLMVSG
tara:strand:+ start:2041 stop:3249 length:1209 start_codon:yes stop_codon:yes gene_type:complete